MQKPLRFRLRNNSLLQTRPYSSLSSDTLDVIKTITLDHVSPPQIVGSFKYIIHEYPADIDLFEKYEICCSKDKAAHDIAKRIKMIANNIKTNKNIYLGDFKAGIDRRFYIDIGHMHRTSLYGYKPQLIRESIIKLKVQGLIDTDEMDNLLKLVVDNPNVFEYIRLEKHVHDKYIVRWTLDELIKGKKELVNGPILTLEDAVTHKSVVKIDVWAFLHNRHIEMSNYFLLKYTDAQGKKHILSNRLDNYDMSLIRDIHEYNIISKYMKMAKRVWNYAVLKKNYKMLSMLYPLFSSGAAKMYQIIGECECIQNILENIDRPHYYNITKNLEDWKIRLGTIMNDILPTQVALKLFDDINNIIKLIENKNDIKLVIQEIKTIHDKLDIYVNKYVQWYLKKINFNINKM